MRIKLADGSGAIDLKYLVEDMDRHGNVRIYFRRKGEPKTRLLQPLGTEAFLKEYKLAAAGVRPAPPPKPRAMPKPESLRWLAKEYYGTAEFKQMDPQTRKRRRTILDEICQMHGDKPYKRLERRHVRKLRDDLADTPGSANDRLKALRAIYGYAAEEELIDHDPTQDVPYFVIVSEGFHTWSIPEVRQYEAFHPIGTKARLALALFLFLGARVSDTRRFGPQMEVDGSIRWTEVKGRKRVLKQRELPILPELRAVLDATPASGHLAYLVTAFGKPFSTKGLSNRLKKWCVEAGLPHCSAHGLRKAGATIAADNGATEYQLMAIYGWESTKQAAVYTRKANRKRLAGDALHLVVPSNRKLRPGS